ncbi:hypothetical protein [Paenibacillus harenae]|uniref:Uncharacterized protein n=1 Tax=Paenibacillus harenae TaxID=306543 RepID=A0ABT9UAW0_PAEHA|nr:hypothetical protein [Paenibacillus harenae]MDQ0116733.1 hypothetical protein [Paenibacillus harenae]
MLGFEQKVDYLRRSEALVYTVCIKLLADELAACKAAEQLLRSLFNDRCFWMACEAERGEYLVKATKAECLRLWRESLQQTS